MTLVAQARLASLLARGFAYPTVELHEAIRTGSYRQDVKALAEALGLETHAQALSEALDEPGALDPYALEGEYTRLFERNVVCPLNESGYAGGRGMGAVHDLAYVSSFYAAFGFKVSPQTKELADHLCVELEFLGVLLAKEAYANERGWDQRARVASDARSKYVAEHLALWLPRLDEKLAKNAELKFYPALAKLAIALIAASPLPVRTQEKEG
jgi:putative dimethyl sulfoxide reductase chaperone